MKKKAAILITLILPVLLGLNSCGPLLERPPDNTPPTEAELYGEENTMTLSIDGQSIVFNTNGKFTHLSYKGTDEIPAYSILDFGGKEGDTGINIMVYQDGDIVTQGGYDGASSIFSLDGSVILDLTLNGVRYYSLEYGPGVAGTTIYYNSFVSIKDLKLQSYNQAVGEKDVKELKGTFRGFLKPYNDPVKGTQIIISGKINYKAPE